MIKREERTSSTLKFYHKLVPNIHKNIDEQTYTAHKQKLKRTQHKNKRTHAHELQ